MNLIDEWQAGCWSVAALQLCEMHIVEGCDEEFRCPEQWMFVAWRPNAKALPRAMPDGWGLTVGIPWHKLTEIVGTDPVYELDQEECLWSSWLSIPLVCDRYEPWLTTVITDAKAKAHRFELSVFGMRYGDHAKDTQRFLNQISTRVPSEGSVDQIVQTVLANLAGSKGEAE